MKVLAIEDQSAGAILLMSMLRSFGHEAEHVNDSTEALARVNEGGYRVVVSDWRMPGIDGLELCRRIRAQEGEYVYFILVSANRVTKQSRQLALAAGVDDFLQKPIDPDELGMRLHVAERIIHLSERVKQMEAFLPVCGNCRKVRQDPAFWQEVDGWLHERKKEEVGLGVCPDCLERVLGERRELPEA